MSTTVNDHSSSPQTNNTLFFDGVCNLCNGAVDFVLSHERSNKMQFASLQSDAGKAMLESLGLSTDELGTMIFTDDNGKVYLKSSAALRVARHLKWPWKALSWFLIVPKPLRDLVYTLVARYRFKLFGKAESCRLPTAEERERFL